MATYYILSLDGGGVKALLTIILLERLEAARPGLLTRMDLIAGTSAGGVLALGLASGLTPAECRVLFEALAPAVFARSLVRYFSRPFIAQYSNHTLKQALVDQFGNKRLGDLSNKVLISSFDLDNDPDNPLVLRTWKPKFFHNYPGPDSDTNEKIVNVAMRTTAAPTYFPVYQGYIDGGLVAGSPSVCALAQALHPGTGGQILADVALLSLGTGRTPHFLTMQDADWGLLPWAAPLIDIILEENNSGVADYQCRQIVGDRYHRLNPTLPERIDLNEVDKIPIIKEVAAKVDLTSTLAWLDSIPG
jgi:patatin-like phospholipase/acyl hydrolase